MERVLRAVPTSEAHQCPSCRALMTELCGDHVVEQSWFRLAPEARHCAVHREGSRAKR
jgi:hypothetical protein